MTDTYTPLYYAWHAAYALVPAIIVTATIIAVYDLTHYITTKLINKYNKE